MTHRSNAADVGPFVSRNDVAERVSRALCLYVGRGRRYSVKQLSNATGVPDRVIECAKASPDNTDWRPMPIEALLSIARFLGADFTNEWLGLADQGAFDLPEEEPDPMRVAIGAAEDTAEIVRRASDGEFDREDRAALKSVGQRKITRGMQLVAAAKAA